MKQIIFKTIAFLGFILMLGAAGGLDTGSTFVEAMTGAAIGGILMFTGYVMSREPQGGGKYGM